FRLSLLSNDPATTDIYTLSLHDALPIYNRSFSDHHSHAVVNEQPLPDLRAGMNFDSGEEPNNLRVKARQESHPVPPEPMIQAVRSEEHTSELQSPYDLVCRLLLEKKKSQ